MKFRILTLLLAGVIYLASTNGSEPRDKGSPSSYGIEKQDAVQSEMLPCGVIDEPVVINTVETSLIDEPPRSVTVATSFINDPGNESREQLILFNMRC